MQVLISAVLTQSYGGYVMLLRSEFGWSNTMLSSGYAMLRFESNLLGPAQGWITDRFGPRRVMTAGVVMLGLGFVLFSRIDSPLEFFGAFVVIAVGASFCGWTTLAVAIVRIFPTGRSWPMSVAKFGMGVGGLAAPLVLGALAAYGWRTTALVSGIVVLVAGLSIMPLIQGSGRHVVAQAPPSPDAAETVSRPDGETHGARQDIRHPDPGAAEVNFSARQALRTRAFWMLSLGHTCAVLVVAALLVHLVPFLMTELGYSLGGAGLVVAGLTAAQMVGTMLGGLFGDRLNRRRILTATMFMHGGGVLFLTYAQNATMVIVFVVMHGLAWGIRAPLQQSLRADYFGAASFGTILGFSSLLVMIGSTGGPLLSGYLVDRTGGYRIGFTAMALVAIAGSIFFFSARRPRLGDQDGTGEETTTMTNPVPGETLRPRPRRSP